MLILVLGESGLDSISSLPLSITITISEHPIWLLVEIRTFLTKNNNPVLTSSRIFAHKVYSEKNYWKRIVGWYKDWFGRFRLLLKKKNHSNFHSLSPQNFSLSWILYAHSRLSNQNCSKGDNSSATLNFIMNFLTNLYLEYSDYCPLIMCTSAFFRSFCEDSQIQHEGSWVWQEITDEGWRSQWLKHCVYNNKDEDNSPNVLNNINLQNYFHRPQ